MTASDSTNSSDPDRTIRYPEIQKVLDDFFSGQPTNPDGTVRQGGGRS